jgi:hypothetical protein
MEITSCSKGVQDISGLPNTASDYKKKFDDIKLLNVMQRNRQEHFKAQMLSEPRRGLP